MRLQTDDMNRIISKFNELNEVYDFQYSIFIDCKGLELFDMRLGRSIHHDTYKHRAHFYEFLYFLCDAIINVGCIKYRIGRRPNQSQACALRRLKRYYSESEISYFLNFNNEIYGTE